MVWSVADIVVLAEQITGFKALSLNRFAARFRSGTLTLFWEHWPIAGVSAGNKAPNRTEYASLQIACKNLPANTDQA